MRCKCGNYLGDASTRQVGDVVLCNGCRQVTIVNRAHTLRDTLKNNNKFLISIGRPPLPLPQFSKHYD